MSFDSLHLSFKNLMKNTFKLLFAVALTGCCFTANAQGTKPVTSKAKTESPSEEKMETKKDEKMENAKTGKAMKHTSKMHKTKMTPKSQMAPKSKM